MKKRLNDIKVTADKQPGKETDAIPRKTVPGDTAEPVLLERLVDSQYILERLPLTKRSLQRLRSNGILSYVRIGNGNVMYRERDVQEMIIKYYKKGKNA